MRKDYNLEKRKYVIGGFIVIIALIFLGRLFGIGAAPVNPQDYLLWGQDYFGLLAAGAILATPLPEKMWNKVRHSILADILLVALFWVVVYYISTAAQDPFLYFKY